MRDPVPVQVVEWTELDAQAREALANLMIRVVATGASISFLHPLSNEKARAFWDALPRSDVRLVVATIGDAIVGTVQVHLAGQPNGGHRAEVAKMMVDPAWHRRGIGRSLLAAAEAIALHHGRTTLVLDTEEGSPGNTLYLRAGWTAVGRIADYARSSSGALHATVIYAKWLTLAK